jgi:hypothetical protein
VKSNSIARARAELEPGVLVALGDEWTCGVLRTELIERGHEVTCVTRIASALLMMDVEPTRPVCAVVVEQATLSERDRVVLEWFRALEAAPPIVLVTGAAALKPVEGPWDRVLREPMTMDAIADVVGHITRGDIEPNRATRRPGECAPLRGFELTLGPPWPRIRCPRCSARRHCEMPRSPSERELVRAALVKFGVQHESCA